MLSYEPSDPQLLTEREAASRLAVSSHALRYWRTRKTGPPFVRLGRRCVRYPLSGLRDWIEQQLALQRSNARIETTAVTEVARAVSG